MMSKLTLTVGIPAYNAEKNIDRLLNSILKQREVGFMMKQIIVYSDQSSDQTLSIANSIKSKLIKVIGARTRGGFAVGVGYMIEITKTDLLLLLNDDIRIDDNNFIEKLVTPFLTNNKVGLVCGNPQPLKPNTFIEAGLVSRLRASEELSMKIRSGSNIFSCDGKTMLLSRGMYSSIEFPINVKAMGNVDAYFYFSCLKLKLKYVFVSDARVYYRNASTLKDYIKWIGRNNTNFYLLKDKFSEVLINREYKKPVLLFFSTLLKQFIFNPLGMSLVFILEFYILIQQNNFIKNFSPTWDVVSSTKKL